MQLKRKCFKFDRADEGGGLTATATTTTKPRNQWKSGGTSRIKKREGKTLENICGDVFKQLTSDWQPKQARRCSLTKRGLPLTKKKSQRIPQESLLESIPRILTRGERNLIRKGGQDHVTGWEITWQGRRGGPGEPLLPNFRISGLNWIFFYLTFKTNRFSLASTLFRSFRLN